MSGAALTSPGKGLARWILCRVPPARPAEPTSRRRGRDIPRSGGFRERRNVRTLLIGKAGSSFRGACLLRLGGGGGSGEAVIEARVREITGNIWLAFYLRFLIKWPSVCGGREGERVGERVGGFKGAGGDREEAGGAHHTLLVKGIREWCWRGDTTLRLLARQWGLGGMQQEGRSHHILSIHLGSSLLCHCPQSRATSQDKPGGPPKADRDGGGAKLWGDGEGRDPPARGCQATSGALG